MSNSAMKMLLLLILPALFGLPQERRSRLMLIPTGLRG